MGVLSSVLLAVFLILVGVTWAGWATISLGFLGVSALVVAGAILFELLFGEVERPALIRRRGGTQ